MFFKRSELNTKLQCRSELMPTALPICIIGRTARLLCLSVISMMSCASYAQTPADIDAAQRQAEIIQRQEQQRLQRERQEVQRRTEEVKGIDTTTLQPKIEVPDIGAPCREIKEIVIIDAPRLSDRVRKNITTEFTGHCLNSSDIEHILSQITKNYIDRGYITTRVYLAPQDLSKGRLEILVVEGIVEKVMVDDGGAKSVSVSNVFPGVEGNVLNLRDLEQGIDQINRLTSNNAKLDIEPGEKPGTSTVVVHNHPTSPYHLIASYDNQGYVLTGDKQVGVSVGADNLLGFDELFFATHRQSVPGDLDSRYSQSDSLYFSIPFGYSTFSMGPSRSKYVETIKTPSGVNLLASGDITSNFVSFDRVIYRDQSTRASLTATLTTKKYNNYLNGQFLAASSRNLTVLDLDSHLNTGLAGGVLTIDLGYARGLNIIDALNDPEFLPDSAPHAQFGKFKYGIGYVIPFKLLGKDLSFSSRLTGQRARNVLFGSEQIQIGGLYSVRGFVLNILAGDDGYYVRNELSVSQPVVIGKETVSTRIYAGYDAGAVSNSDPTIPQGHLSGMAVGISVNWRGATIDLFNTRPLTLPSFMVREGSQTWFRLSYAI